MIGRRFAILATAMLAAGCTSSAGDDADQTESTTVQTTDVEEQGVSTPDGVGSGDTIAYCSMAADLSRISSIEGFASLLREMEAVEPDAVAGVATDIAAGWDGESVDGLADSVDRFNAYVLDECGIVIDATPR